MGIGMRPQTVPSWQTPDSDSRVCNDSLGVAHVGTCPAPVPHGHPPDLMPSTQRALVSSFQWELFLAFQEMTSGRRWPPLGCSRVTCNGTNTNSFSTSAFLFLGGKTFISPSLVESHSAFHMKEVSYRGAKPNTRPEGRTSKRLGWKGPIHTTF